MILRFSGIVKADHRTYTKTQISGIFDYLTQPIIRCEPFRQFASDTRMPQTTCSSWREKLLQLKQEEWFSNCLRLSDSTERSPTDHIP
jgi:hypothetical protein